MEAHRAALAHGQSITRGEFCVLTQFHAAAEVNNILSSVWFNAARSSYIEFLSDTLMAAEFPSNFCLLVALLISLPFSRSL